jgi:hypothetical protein
MTADGSARGSRCAPLERRHLPASAARTESTMIGTLDQSRMRAITSHALEIRQAEVKISRSGAFVRASACAFR